MKTLGLKDYNADELRLFIDSSKRSLKAVLLSNQNKVASVPIAHFVHLKETHENLKILLQSMQYDKHQWSIYSNIKVIGLLLAQQSGFTNYPSFLCEWDIRARNEHWIKKNWKPRENLEPGSKNVIHDSLIDPAKVFLPSLHVKLGLMKQFVKALNQDGKSFKSICEKFVDLSDGKLKEGIFEGPKIKQLMRDEEFDKTMSPVEKKAWIGFKNVVNGFLGNTKSSNIKTLVNNMLQAFRKYGCNISLNV